MIFETHAHYDDEQFDEDRDILLKSFQQNEIEYVVNAGASIESTKKTVELMEQYPFVYGAVGIHPSDSAEFDDGILDWLEQLTKLEKTVAIGEIGLDYYWPEPSHDVQKVCFEQQMELAKKVKLPLIIHSRDAGKDTLDMIKAADAKQVGGVIHCFSYSIEMAREYLNMGFYLGIGGVVTFQNAKKLKEVVAYAPLDRLLVETDCPYLAPVPNRGKRNSSLNLPYIIREIAAIKGIKEEEVEEATYRNAKIMYGLQ